MKTRLFICVFVACSLVFNACKKNKIASKIEVDELITPTKQPIHKSIWINDSTGFFCGGVKNENGFIFKTTNNGKTWTEVFSSPDKCLYDIFFVNDTIAYSCGDNLLLLKSKDHGNTWKEVSFANITLEYFNHTPLRCIYGNYDLLMVVGGENYHNGNALWLQHDEMRWVWHFDHEFRTGLNFTTENYVLAGYGNPYRTTDHGYHYSPLSFSGDFMTSSATMNSTIGYVCGYDGGIYRTEDGGDHWKTLLEPNKTIKKRIHLNGICFLDLNKGWVVGNEGVILSTEDGNSFKLHEALGKFDLLSIVKDQQGKMIVSTSNGKLLRIKN